MARGLEARAHQSRRVRGSPVSLIRVRRHRRSVREVRTFEEVPGRADVGQHSRAVWQGLAAAPILDTSESRPGLSGKRANESARRRGPGSSGSQSRRQTPPRTGSRFRYSGRYPSSPSVSRRSSSTAAPRKQSAKPITGRSTKMGNVGWSLGTGDVPGIQGASLPVVLTTGCDQPSAGSFRSDDRLSVRDPRENVGSRRAPATR